MPSIKIFYTNDLHNQLEEEKVRNLLPKDNSYLLFDSGDAIKGSNTYFKLNEPILEKMNRLQYNAMAMGNREFHYLRSVIRKRVSSLNFPILAANLVDLKNILTKELKPYILINHCGISIGVFGLTVPQYHEYAKVEKISYFRFLEETKAAQQAIEELHKQGSQLIILLSHLGLKKDKYLAETVSGIDLILGGHSHTILPTPLTINNTIITQTGARGKFLGTILLNVEPYQNKFKILEVQGELLPIKDNLKYELSFANGKKTVLFISNGHGEDSIAATVVDELQKSNNLNIIALPLVGKGEAYSRLGVPVTGPYKPMPSGGISGFMNLPNLFKDLRQGLIKLTLSQCRFLQKLHKKIDFAVAVGDLFPVIMAHFFLKKPIIFIGTAKSDFVSSYSNVEKLWMKQCLLVFTRDKDTMETLKNAHISAEYAGNAMMDALTPQGLKIEIKKDEVPLALLPGSRENAYADFPIIVAAMEELAKSTTRFIGLTAIPNSLDINRIEALISTKNGWYKILNSQSSDSAIAAQYNYKEGITLLLIKGYFADILHLCRLVIGQAGTGNEQAAGLGKPVVAFDNTIGEKLGWYRKRQKKLLGDAVSVVCASPSAIADEVLEIIKNPERAQLMKSAGEARMGSPGAAKEMANAIEELVCNVT